MRAALAWGVVALCAGCAAFPPTQTTPPPRPEEEDIVPVGGYEMLAGLWETSRQEPAGGGALKDRRLRLQVTFSDGELRAAAPPDEPYNDHNVRVVCAVSHRTCIGTWYDNDGRGTMTWRMGTDFASFKGSFEGQRRGATLPSLPWTGELVRR